MIKSGTDKTILDFDYLSGLVCVFWFLDLELELSQMLKFPFDETASNNRYILKLMFIEQQETVFESSRKIYSELMPQSKYCITILHDIQISYPRHVFPREIFSFTLHECHIEMSHLATCTKVAA